MYRRPILDIFSRSGDIRDQSLKWSKIDRNFSGVQLFGGSAPPPNFWTCIIKYTQIPIRWQSFRAIGRGNLENAWRKKRKHHEHFIRPPVITVHAATRAAKISEVVRLFDCQFRIRIIWLHTNSESDAEINWIVGYYACLSHNVVRFHD